MILIKKYFPEITGEQERQFQQLDALYHEWNAKINVISRKDIDNLYEHHVLHSLAIAKWIKVESLKFKVFRQKPQAAKPEKSSLKFRVLDFGCGGGFPGVPLAIMFPEWEFTLIDGTGKKVRVAQEVADAIGLKNLKAIHRRGEEEKGTYDFIVSRAVMPLPDMVKIVRKNIAKKPGSGIICLKGGNLDEEMAPFKNRVEVMPISSWFEEEWFKEKNVVYLPL